jgi:hypothetical protein
MCTATRQNSLLTVAVLATCLTTSGCIPGVAWMPDSRGFYFTAGQNCQKLLYFDVAAKETRTVVADTGGSTIWPALSPDGRRVAVAVPVERKGKEHFQVVVYNTEGKEMQRTRAFRLERKKASKDDNKFGPPFMLFWAPPGQGDKLLAQANNGAALIDLKDNQCTDLGDQILWVFGNSPARPDGKGFLSLMPSPEEKSEKEDVAFYDWKGNRQLLPRPDARALSPLTFPYLASSRWQGPVATARGFGLEVAIDTDRRTTSVTPLKPDLTAESLVIRQSYQFAEIGVRVRVVELKDEVNPDRPPLRVEVLPPGAPAKVLTEKASLTSLLPSPNGKVLVVRYLVGGPGQQTLVDRLVVIDARGEFLADMDVSRK